MPADQVIVVTGASSGFGAMTVRALADAGHRVYAGMRDTAGRNAKAAQEAADYASEHAVALHAIEMDVSEQASVDAAVEPSSRTRNAWTSSSTTLATWCSVRWSRLLPNSSCPSTTPMSCPPSA